MPGKSLLLTDDIFQSIIDALPVMLFWTDINNIYLGNNLLHAKAFGFKSAAEVVGKSLQDTFDKIGISCELATQVYEEHERIMSSKENEVLEYSAFLFDHQGNKKNKAQICRSHKQPLLDQHGKVVGLVGISLDITDLKEAMAAAEASNKAKSEFIANMSHDLRTPMAGISGMLDALLFSVEDAEAALDVSYKDPMKSSESAFKSLIAQTQKYATVAKSSTQELMGLFNEILQAVSLESGKLERVSSAFNLRALLQRNVDLLQSLANHKSLSLSFSMSADVPRNWHGLRVYLDRVLSNLNC